MLFFFLSFLFALSQAHSVSFCYDIDSKPGFLQIYEEHWHGNIRTADYGILFKDSTNPLVNFRSWKLTPHGFIWDRSFEQVRASLHPNARCFKCPGQAAYNDWFTYEFPVCVFGAQATSFTVYGDPAIVETHPSNGQCEMRINLPRTACTDADNNGLCENCNCVSCTGTPYDSVCGNKVKNSGEECDDASDPTNCKNCKCLSGWATQGTTVCQVADPCRIYSMNNNQGNPATATCANSGSNRLITCVDFHFIRNTNYETSKLFAPSDTFPGCLPINECTRYGFLPAGGANTATPVGCVDGVNARTITCAPGYSVVNRAAGTSQVTLTGSDGFTGCTGTNECTLYGCNPNCSPNYDANRCADGINSRTAYCKAGFWVTGTKSNFITLTGSDPFPGCTDINECTEYGNNGRPQNLKPAPDDCTNGIDQRTMNCIDGFVVSGTTQQSRVLPGNTVFSGCVDANECEIYGYNTAGKGNAIDCQTPDVGSRRIICKDGYTPVTGTAIKFVNLAGSAPFLGCFDVDECKVFGFTPGKTCVNGIDKRTITCEAGYFITGTTDGKTATRDFIGAASFPGCSDIDECKVYGFNEKPANTKSCVQGKTNERIITCTEGHYIDGKSQNTVTETLVGSQPFVGCSDVNECTLYGASGKDANVKDCEHGKNTRTIICTNGYYATAPTNPRSKELVGSEAFEGCFNIDECKAYGPAPPNYPVGVQSCEDRIDSRLVTCSPGYSVKGGTIVERVVPQALLVPSSQAFPGCDDVDECKVYGSFPHDQFVARCVNTGINKRTVTCQPGYSVVGLPEGEPSIERIGNIQFPGCIDIVECTLYGYNDKIANTATCVETEINTRTITCAVGYKAAGKSTPSIKLTGKEKFQGCTEIDECDVYGWAGGESCKHGIDQRTVKCRDGFWVVGTTQPEISLLGSASFPGCFDINECEVYGYSERKGNTVGCKDMVNSREITCAPGFQVGQGKDISPKVVLIGSREFVGCFDINECQVYGYGNKSSFTELCENQLNQRKITCERGYFATPPDDRTVTLVAAAPFDGCSDIDECKVYGYSNKPQNAQMCRHGVDSRRITCDAGYAAIPPIKRDIFLDGNMAFPGCVDIKECEVYSFSGKSNFTKLCREDAPDTRTIVCMDGYTIQDDRSSSITLLKSSSFDGCSRWCGDGKLVPGETCDDTNEEADDGCNADCQVEAGWICPAASDKGFGTACCPALPPNFYPPGYDKLLECYDGWWITRNEAPFKIDTPASVKRDKEQLPAFQFDNSTFRFCGHLQFGTPGNAQTEENVRNRQITAWMLADILVAGRVSIERDGVLYFDKGGHLNITTLCALPPQSTIKDWDTRFEQNEGTIGYWGVNWTEDIPESVPAVAIDADGCVSVTGAFYINATTFATGQNHFVLIQSATKCVKANKDSPYQNFDHYLPNHGCSDVNGGHDESTLYITVNKRDLCPAEMAGIGLAIIIGAIILVAVLAYALGMIGGSSEDGGYVAL